MSWRHATPLTATSTTAPSFKLMRNFRHLSRLQRLQKRRRSVVIEQRIGRLDAKKESIPRCQREARHVERRMVRQGDPAERQQSENRRDRREQNGHFER